MLLSVTFRMLQAWRLCGKTNFGRRRQLSPYTFFYFVFAGFSSGPSVAFVVDELVFSDINTQSLGL